MKRSMMKFGFFACLLAITFFAASCGGGEATQQTQETEQTQQHDGHDHGDHEGHEHGQAEQGAAEDGPEYTSKYVCPMHCEGSGSAEAGECPVCGMAYVVNEKASK